MNKPIAARPLWLVVLSAGTIVGLAMGLRQVLGLYLRPMTMDLGIGREPFSNAMAVANLVWGLGAVAFGAIADRWGAAKVAVAGSLASVGGFLLMYAAHDETDLLIAGVLLGIGVGGTGITALVGAVGRAAPPDKRTAAIAALGMASGIGGFVAFPYAHLLIEAFGWKASLLALAASTALVIPLALTIRGRPQAPVSIVRAQSLREAFTEAFSHSSFWLLTIGFFVCGFHVSFYSVHLPAYVQDQGLGLWVGVWALMAIGVANIIGTWIAGQSGRFVEKRVALSAIYFARAALFLGILYLPITPFNVIAISALLGLFWLSTIPLTSGLVATFFGTGWMSMLFGFVFLSHQLGSFAGLWLAGRLYDATHSYSLMWWICVGLALTAALLNLPIRERPVARMALAAAE
jgi:MFS family permease